MVKSDNFNSVLADIYYDVKHPAGYSGKYRLYKAAKEVVNKITIRDVEEFLSSSETYTLHHPLGKASCKGTTQCSGLNTNHEADLAVMDDKLTELNDGYRYILVVVDVLSRYVMFEPMRRKTGAETADAYTKILRRERRLCTTLTTDAGLEFRAAAFQNVLKECSIMHHIPKNHDVKAGFAENAVRRCKSKLYKFMTAKNTSRWVGVLQDVASGLNRACLKSIGCAPVDVTHKNERVVWQRVYEKHKQKQVVHRYKIGDTVRLAVKRGETFRKGYTHTFTPEVFKIKKLLFKSVPAYIICDLADEEIDSVVYEHELVRFNNTSDVWKIDQILDSRKVRGRKQIFVSWKGFPKKFNCWIDARQIADN